MGDSLNYHLNELKIARDRSHEAYFMPAIEARYKTILDIGCGMGQTLLDLELPPEVEAYGVDPDAPAIQAGQQMTPPNIHLSVGSGEKLPFEDGMFDLVICRVALPYMRMEVALAEMQRVLRPGGDVWLMLHPVSMYTKRGLRSLKQGKVKDSVFCGFVLWNGLLYSVAGRQMSFGGRVEACQTKFGMERALARRGFEAIRLEQDRFFLARATKKAAS